MIVSKRDQTDIYSGCLSYLRNDVSAELPENQNWFQSSDFKNLVGTKQVYNVHNYPYDKPPAYFEISFGNKYIFPTSYSLQGRRLDEYHLLKGWNFFGKNIHNQWVLLSSFSNNAFSHKGIKTFDLNVNESYKGFKIQMTQPNSYGEWALCLGQIEVFGDIYSKPFMKGSHLIKKPTCQRREGTLINIYNVNNMYVQ